MAEPIDIPLHWLRAGANITAGMNLLVVASIAHMLRTSTQEVDPPIEVFHLGEKDYAIHEGRHRWMASYVAGRSTVRGVVLER